VYVPSLLGVFGLGAEDRLRVVGHPVPRDARLVGLEIDTDRSEMRLVLESATFGELAPGAPIPELEPTLFQKERVIP
jgi:hypothetical protein